MPETQFPDITHVEYGQDGTPILGNSVGNNRILFYLRENAGQRHAPLWNLYLINIYTLARNAYRKGISLKELTTCIDKDSDLLLTYIHAYTTYRHSMESAVVFYAPEYKSIPQDLMRQHVGNTLELDTLYYEIFKKLPTKLVELSELPLTRKFLCQVGQTGRMPYLDLLDKLKQISPAYSAGGAFGTAMISHCPLDFHIHKSIPKIQLLESYTGNVLSVSDFGQKLTKDVVIPFNNATHRLFGDSLQLLPLLTGKDRKTLIQLAETKNWAIQTESQIIIDAEIKFSQVSRSILTLLKF